MFNYGLGRDTFIINRKHLVSRIRKFYYTFLYFSTRVIFIAITYIISSRVPLFRQN